MKTNLKSKDFLFDLCITLICVFTIIVMLYPFLNVLAVSFNEPRDTMRGGITFYPRKFSTESYAKVFRDSAIYDAAYISVLRTIIGTAASLFCTSLLAYILSRKGFILNKFITVLMLITMYFSAGIIPTYVLFKYLNLLNNFSVYIVPSLFYGFNVIIIRTYMEGLPDSLVESAQLDGAKEMTIFLRILFPLSLPSIATVGLFLAVGQWNSWFDTMLYAPKVKTLQYLLMQKLDSVNASMNSSQPNDAEMQITVTTASVRATYTVITMLPIVCVYPFVQRFFIQGMTVGGVKE